MIEDFTPLWISLKTALIATIFVFTAGIIFAYKISKYEGRFKGIIDGILILPMILPPTVVGYILLVFFGKNRFAGQFLDKFDINLVFSWEATVVASTVVAFPLMYKTARASFEQIDKLYVDAAETLGCKPWRLFWKVIFPLAWPGIAAGTVLAFARALGEFGATLMLAGSIPGKTQTVPIAIYFAAESGNMDKAQSWVIIIVAIALFLVGLANKWYSKQYFKSMLNGGNK
ncbi:MAG: molybdate ABC transporter permease subunit [Candidatus Muiribacteriota bacterium]